ncbi:MAG: hypothetical protein UV61_C0009G0065 [Candidatus Gottesmanbacteria bacterium GW2011_GWB1_43_11]|uniref:Uncharacterized protein n=1 Tax=Candidatus Gottesmanbacteria bacterium GW2011_GWB1_43_11 TaxID=1618446 RepID=A0A0G1FI59_9BACT|nr:MAG: hypothetical protein UV17_C0013G0006 [Candidatus Gottesmanbacteria bacterium GW2011_GWA1_42_26]KKS80905.1 MAG: hypothetical protein UV55_C0026G0015 [Candidatus Gottesmanbacteria bacterium GW2011_GWC1_43_10]KKS86538.1 MAG: hypothetical protein UV61_C0009G0065 [Candidatus Gottesmanbacteria bacterium GW2011_GWB1_43_11]OGG07866.1 MAG: hypothetical protein A2699_02265 [Candidatus Gottesmanbacteria bacterium RIFCSPHIGHO2_01_FULL_43_15]OGG27879.1 MAG: hypothetical protein A3A59_00585 [Candidat
MRKKLLLILGLVILIGGVIGGVMFWKYKSKTGVDNESEQIKNNLQELGGTAGAMAEPKTPEEKALQEKLVALEEKLPLITPEFEIRLNPRNDIYIVTLSEPYEENKQKFLDWIKTNGFAALPRENFEYLLK